MINRTIQWAKERLSRFLARARRYATKRTAIAVAILIAFLGFAIVKSIQSKSAAQDEAPTIRVVEIATLSSLSSNGSVIDVVGTVKSKNQADLRAQRAGVINYIGASVGDFVPAGTIIASVENDSERASVQLAQAGVAQAQAQLNKVVSGARTEELAVLGANTEGAEQALQEANTGARNTLLSAYTTLSSVFEGGVDAAFSDADGANPELRFTSTNSTAALSAKHERFIIEGSILGTLDTRITRARVLTEEALLAELTKTEADAQKVRTFLDSLITALDGGVTNASITSANITTYTTAATTARTNILTTLTSLSAARSSINSARNAFTVAQESEDQGVSGARQEDIEVAQAGLDSARASLAQAVASLEDTRIRTPVSGTLTTFTLERGSFVTSFQNVGVVANQGALEVVFFVPSDEAAQLGAGDVVLVDGTYEGVITSIAKGLDQTRRQIEVRVGLSTTTRELPNGKSVAVTLPNTNDSTGALEITQVPISALKLVGDEAFVFTIGEENQLIAHTIEIGEVNNTHVQIDSDLPTNAFIVVDARGLNEGDEVTTTQ